MDTKQSPMYQMGVEDARKGWEPDRGIWKRHRDYQQGWKDEITRKITPVIELWQLLHKGFIKTGMDKTKANHKTAAVLGIYQQKPPAPRIPYVVDI